MVVASHLRSHLRGEGARGRRGKGLQMGASFGAPQVAGRRYAREDAAVEGPTTCAGRGSGKKLLVPFATRAARAEMG